MAFMSKAVMVGLVAVVLLLGGSAGGAEPVNLLSNGGFEDGLFKWLPDPGHTLVREAAEAHSGKACVTGEVDAPDRARIIRRRVPVRMGNRYQFEIWARSTNRTKLVLWMTPPGSKARMMAATWEKVPRQWQRYTVPITVAADGMLELQIVAPSSHGAPAGQIWIDDVALYETAMPPLHLVSTGKGFNDTPAMARAGDGSLYVAWNSFRDGVDSLQLARLRLEGDRFVESGTWQVAGGEGTYVLGPTLVSAGPDAVLLYAAENDGNWDIQAVSCDANGPREAVAVSSHEAVDVKPAAAWRDGTLWVAWESNRNGCRQIFATSVADDRAGDAVPISPRGISSYDPSIAALPGGRVCVAWHCFWQNNYDVYMRPRAPDGTWTQAHRLTRAPAVDRHPLLVARDDQLWILYEHALVERYNIGRTNSRSLILAQVTPQGLLAPRIEGACPLEGRCEAPSAVFDASGRLWVAHLRPRLPRAGWDTYLTCFLGDRWQAAEAVSIAKGMDRRPCLALVDGRPIVAFQADDMPQSWSDLDLTDTATSNIFVASMKSDAARQVTAMQLEPLVEPDEPFEAGELRVARGEDTPTPTIEYQGRTLKLFYGDLHEHTDLSVCNRLGDQSIDESYQHMRDIARHDFACATDHGYNLNPYLWNYTAKQARVNDDPDRFLTFLGEEWTSTFEEYSEKHPFGFYGHRNLILADSYFPRWWNARNRQTPADVWEDLRKLNANFVQIPHQIADTGNVPTDWNYTDEKAQPVAEIFQTRGSYEYKGAPREAKRTTPQGYFIQDAWARGIVIGVIASPDHGGGYGKACVFAPDLTRESILEALRSRHCYGTTAAKMFLDVRVDGHLMGEKLPAAAGKSVEIKITARCPGDIRRIEICRNNRFIHTHSPKGRQTELTFFDRRPLEGRSYYYVRVLQEDEEIAWSSPVWFAPEGD